LASDSAWARSVGAARINNAPTAASPRILVSFTRISTSVFGVTPAPCRRSNHSFAVTPVASWSERHECEMNNSATNAPRTIGSRVHAAIHVIFFKTGAGRDPYLLQASRHGRLSWPQLENGTGYRLPLRRPQPCSPSMRRGRPKAPAEVPAPPATSRNWLWR
jgi:hypothetical protein